MGGLQGWHLVIIIVLAILLFGAPKLPGLARSVGQSLRIFRSEVRQMKDENGPGDTSGTTPVDGRVVSNPSQQSSQPTFQQGPPQASQYGASQPYPENRAPQYPSTGDQPYRPEDRTNPVQHPGTPPQGGAPQGNQ